ncbi:Carbohydrate binding module (family 6) [Roseateles sp. YR242]|uniref:rhamnogalacturonan lyase family protein n=1 Tax=Roseateles sp. YR242 TaxID=1855305 RepID=UPI0008B1BE5C|nr:carbohydrate-binding protein [Roseateles sp. YR242]SEK30040.1 Carbohydrate binding module (family 6) [Roseateles sp. YR242]
MHVRIARQLASILSISQAVALSLLLMACGGGKPSDSTVTATTSSTAVDAGTAGTAATTPSAGVATTLYGTTPQATNASIAAAAESIGRPPRVIERLGRGVVAVRSNTKNASISWRLLALDPTDVAFNVYRSANGATPVKLNSAPLTTATFYSDAPDFTVDNAYSVRAVINGTEVETSSSFTLTANHAAEPVVRIPLSPVPGTGYYTKYVWVGDLDGDGEYDFVIDRIAPYAEDEYATGLGNQYLEAYKRDGTPLWRIDMGHLSTYLYNIHPSAATLSMGMYDGVTVYDLNGDGKAEVILKIADGVTFPNGDVFTEANPEMQYIAVIDGLSGNLLAKAPFPTQYLAAGGSLGTQLGIGYANGLTPSIYFWGRNRNADKSFNDVLAAWSWSGGSTLTVDWVRPMTVSHVASHQMRIIDVDGDGRDEVATGNFMLNSDGSVRYTMPTVGHGDRFYIGKFSATSTGMDGYGIQQDNPSGLLEYAYDATTGSILWSHSTTPGTLVDVGRGLVGDIDARFPGYEAWSFSGIYNAPTGARTEPSDLALWPAQILWWDGDVMNEGLNETKIEKWNPLSPTATGSAPRVTTLSKWGATLNGTNPMFMGDILGDWRTEVVTFNSSFTELQIYTTNISTDKRFYAMAQNPAYRNHMTIKGYLQSPLPDYYFGDGMGAVSAPNVRYPGSGRMAAETAVLAGGAAVAHDRSGYTGTGFVTFPVTGGSATFQYLDGGAGGTRTIAIRYANGAAGARAGLLKVNGVDQAISFPSTGGWTHWQTLSVAVPLNAGLTNTLAIASNGQDLANIDEITVP